MVIDRVPKPEPNYQTKHYKKYKETSQANRTVDDYQPRKKCKDLFNNGRVSSSDIDSIVKFSNDYLVQIQLVKDYVSHMEDLKLKREKRSAERKLQKQRQEREADDYEDDYDDEHTGQQDEDEDRDVITQIIDGGDVDSDDEDTIYVPNLRTLTRSGRLAGSWRKHFALEEDDLREDENSSESDEENDKSEEENQSDEESDTPDEDQLSEPAALPEPNRSIYSGRTRKPNPKYYF